MVSFKDSEFSIAINHLEQHEISCEFPAWVIRHQKEVFLLAYRMGLKLGFDPEQLTDISIAARFHDIGKSDIDPAIINHQGALNEDQRYIIFEHVHQSYHILRKKGIDSKSILNAVFYHHENFDGSGYPDRLSNEEIPIEAQILRIVDSYSAMLGRRPYQNAENKDSQWAVSQIEQGSGILYNPEMVKIFLEIGRPLPESQMKSLQQSDFNGVLFKTGNSIN
ncbi:MAG: HD domain-containing protein [Candidatus Omnitrophica bacterium]|nr:HD domain-containing protein [Candidatus Omnitrophota bacterium]